MGEHLCPPERSTADLKVTILQQRNYKESFLQESAEQEFIWKLDCSICLE